MVPVSLVHRVGHRLEVVRKGPLPKLRASEDMIRSTKKTCWYVYVIVMMMIIVIIIIIITI